MTTPRARNRQAYNLTKSNKPSRNLSSNLPTNGQNLNGSATVLPNWKQLTNQQLLSLTETELAEMEQTLSLEDKAQLGQKLMQALNQPPTAPPFLTKPLQENPASILTKPPSPPTSSPNFHPEVHTPYTVASGDEMLTGNSQVSTPYTAQSSEEEPPSYLLLLTPLTGKHLRQMQDIEMLLAMVAGAFEMAAEMSGRSVWKKDSDTIGQYGQKVAESWARLGRKYPWMFKAIDRACGTAQAGSMFASTGLLVKELMKNHGINLPTIGSARRVEPRSVPVEHAA